MAVVTASRCFIVELIFFILILINLKFLIYIIVKLIFIICKLSLGGLAIDINAC